MNSSPWSETSITVAGLRGVLEPAHLAEERLEPVVEVADLAVVGGDVVRQRLVDRVVAELGPAVVGLVHVVEVQVEEVGPPAGELVAPTEHGRDDLLGPGPVGALEALEAAVEAELAADVDVGGDAEGRVAGRGQRFGERRPVPRQGHQLEAHWLAVLGVVLGAEAGHHAVLVRVEAGEDRGRRRRRPGRGRVGALEERAARGELREERRGLPGSALVSEQLEVIAPQRVDHDQDDVGPRRLLHCGTRGIAPAGKGAAGSRQGPEARDSFR